MNVKSNHVYLCIYYTHTHIAHTHTCNNIYWYVLISKRAKVGEQQQHRIKQNGCFQTVAGFLWFVLLFVVIVFFIISFPESCAINYNLYINSVLQIYFDIMYIILCACSCVSVYCIVCYKFL